MKTHISIIAVALILAIASSSALATVTTWDTTTGNWNSSSNWDTNSIPDIDDEVKIRDTDAHCTIPNGYTASCYRIYVYDSSTATLTIASGGTLVTDNNFFKTGFSDRDGRTYQTGDVDLGTGDLFTGDYDDENSAFDYEDITQTSAPTAYTAVLNGAGATEPSRDSVDTRIVNSVTGRNGNIIDSQDTVGGWPAYAAGSAPTDTDQDGMPDTWEDSYGTDDLVADNNGDLDSDGYTNLEEYLNSLCD